MADSMRNQKGISKLAIVVLIALLIVILVIWSNYFSKPLTTVMTGGIERAEPAMDKAKQAGDAIDRLNRTTDETAKKIDEEFRP